MGLCSKHTVTICHVETMRDGDVPKQGFLSNMPCVPLQRGRHTSASIIIVSTYRTLPTGPDSAGSTPIC